MKNKNIKLVRIDNRLLHATVALNWHHFVDAKYVIIVDPAHVDDPFIEKVMQLCLPKTMKVKIFSVEQLLEFIAQERLSKEGIIILFKELHTLREAVELGFRYPEIQLPYPASRFVIKKLSDFFKPDEVNAIQYILDKGIRFYFQTSPMDPKDYSVFKTKKQRNQERK